MPTKNENDLTTGQIVYKTPEGKPYTAEQIQVGIETTCKAASEVMETIYNEAIRAVKCYWWALRERPRLAHLMCFAKKPRVRKKNTIRIVREYLKEE